MADINFDCPHCEQNLDAPPDMAGESIECPACEETIEIPAPPKPKAAAPQGGKKRIVMKKRTAAAPRSSAASPRAGGAKKPAAKKPAAKKPASKAAAADGEVSPKSRTVALLLYIFLGGFSVHRFYVGKIGTAIVQILTIGGLGIWWTIDFIMILCGAFKDKQGLPLKNW
jgi:hypothetical protein